MWGFRGVALVRHFYTRTYRSCVVGTARYGSVRRVVWAFYYPQVLDVLGLCLLLEYLNVRLDELLYDLPCSGVIGDHPPDLRQPASRNVHDSCLLLAVFVG